MDAVDLDLDTALLGRLMGGLRSDGDAGAGAGASRRQRGQVFTPSALAHAVCRLVLGAAPRAPVVLDPAAGDGSFLVAAAAVAPAARLLGVERDRRLAAACRARLPHATIHCAEALFAAPRLPVIDAIVGNPPYVRSIRLRDSDPVLWARLRGAFAATSFGEWDLYGAFLERSLAWVRPGGRVGLIVPSRWLTARWAAPLRAHLAERDAVRAVIDLGAAQVFARATTYASIVILARDAVAPPAVLYRRVGDRWEPSAFAPRARGDAPWIAAASTPPVRVGPGGPAAPAAEAPASGRGGRTARAPAIGHRAGLTLGDVARIAKGTGTNADRVFVLRDAVQDGALVRSGDVVVEADATRPCLRGRDVGAAPTARCLVPYVDGRLVPWDELRARWPRAAAHLRAHRDVLEARERGRFAGDRFHAFGRPQNLGFHLDPSPKLVFPDVVRTPRVALDATGALVLDTAYALRPRPGAPPPWDRLEHLLALLRSPALAAWIERASVPLRGDYRRWKTAFLAPMPLP